MKPPGKLPYNYHYQYSWMESEIKRLNKVISEYWVSVCQLSWAKRALESEREANSILTDEVEALELTVESLRKELTELKR